ncbi:acyl-CoA dehydrogenase family protein [Nocardia carnea]|uniref:acyl-CoA dehydrogenase family protein n=1 Tax=Nocardia carnea TaxID=37328 RepID=UPI002453F30D|nr:acyl-CoA dehydrogenase family protein [Nocardia carnea]
MIDIAELEAAARAHAAEWDRTGLPTEVIVLAAGAGLLGPDRSRDWGGHGLDAYELGELASRLGALCTSLRSLLTVGAMVSAAVDRWATAEQRAYWLPRLVSGELVAGLAATESGAGTELGSVATAFEDHATEFRVSGRKLWVSFGEVADVLLVLGRADGGLLSALVRTDQPGVSVEPVTGQLGMRGARIAHITLDGARVPRDQLIGPPGFGLSHVLGTALDHGRYTVAWGCAGMARTCLYEAARYAAERTQGGTRLAEHATIRAALGRGWVDIRSARALCESAARARAAADPETVMTTLAAKYAAAQTAARVGAEAVQILGAAGCAADSIVQRFTRDAAVAQIIEGSRDIAELHLGEQLLTLVARETGDLA